MAAGPILITGPDGFVGRHLLDLLGERARPLRVDVTDADAVRAGVADAAAAAVVHLAALSSVASSWGQSDEVWRVNVVGTVNVLDAVRAVAPSARVLAVSTAEVYGGTPGEPATEDTPLQPRSPYAAAKAASEIACDRARRVDRLDVVVARPFNHLGPGQDERFAVGSWTRQIARLETVGGGRLLVGDLAPERDVTDVRDVCRAYAALLDVPVAGPVYNVASGTIVSMRTVVDRLVALARCPIEVVRDPERDRPSDIARLAGDAGALRAATGWRPQIDLDTTLADALEAARRQLTEAA